MPRSQAHLENNTFVKGLITEASPLTFPENASLDEDNFVLNTDGTRDRRLGIDYEQDSNEQSSGQQIPASGDLPFNTFLWENVGGDAELSFVVVQIGAKISFFNSLEGAISANAVGISFEVGTGLDLYSFASVDGSLVVATNSSNISTFSYDGTLITETTSSLQIRDLFGLEDLLTIDGTEQDLYDPKFTTHRPDIVGTDANETVPPPGTITDAHLYNLRNQSWGVPRRPRDDSLSGSNDPLITFAVDIKDYPSNADLVHDGVFVDPTDSRDPPSEAFFPYKLGAHPVINATVSRGFFVIDALNRGQSRTDAYEVQCSTDILGSARLPLGTIPLDRTPGGATEVAEYGGRVFFSGFSGEVTDGDDRSPNLSSYVLFSKLVKHHSDITTCYQEGDPTDKEVPELVATDGGFIRIQGAYGINRLVNIGAGLAVFAANGVWLIRGESGVGFSATGHEVIKVTERGCLSASSVAVVDNTALYWSEDGIYNITPDEFGTYAATNITHNTIRKHYDTIPLENKEAAQGSFDAFQRKVTWIHGGNLSNSGDVTHLILDVRLGAFSPHTFKTTDGGLYPRTVASIEVPPFLSGTVVDEVVVDGDQVQASAVDVQVSSTIREGSFRQTKFLTVTGVSPSGSVLYTFSALTDQDFLDWKAYDSTGIDAPAFLLTGHQTGGDSSRYKYVPNIFFHFKRTEDAFQVVDGEVVPTKESSCKVQAQWDWANSAQSGKFGREFQAYRYTRHYIPDEITDPYDYGFETIVTRNRLRGKGRALSLLIKSEPLKDLRLVGWGQEMLINRRA